VKKHVILPLLFMLWASGAAAQSAVEGNGSEGETVIFEGFVMPSYEWVNQSGGARAGEYQYLRDSAGGSARFEYDPLPQRFEIDVDYLNSKDYFGEMEYAYRDIIKLNVLTRGIYHNLDHLSLGPDDPSTPSPSFEDRNPDDTYAVEDTIRKAFIRFKTPDFPFHIYASAVTVDRGGTIQQLFLLPGGGVHKISESRYIDWHTEEITMGVNSHLGPLEADYNHAEKKFEAGGEKVLIDVVNGIAYPHNLVPDLKSSLDTIKLHTAYTGRIVGAVTYSSGDKKNLDSNAKSDFRNAAGDLTLVPVAGLNIVVKYRHYDLSVDNPSTISLAYLGNATYNVRPSLSSKRDVATGLVSYRLNDRTGVKGYYTVQTIERTPASNGTYIPLLISPVVLGTTPDFWEVAHRTTKTTEGFGFNYRLMKKVYLRADITATQTANPAYANDPDHSGTAKVSMNWNPTQRIFAFVSFDGIREKRSDMSAPLAGGSRETAIDQALGSVTVQLGDRSAVTASYLYFKNRTDQTLTYIDERGQFILEDGVPYRDTANVVSLSANHALTETIFVTADGLRSYTKGYFRVSGSVPGSNGIDTLSDLEVVEDIVSASVEWRWSRRFSGEFRYQYRHYDDRLDNTQDSTVNTALATLHASW
jgi:hypothetical protein